jgi:hypothetical protein
MNRSAGAKSFSKPLVQFIFLFPVSRTPQLLFAFKKEGHGQTDTCLKELRLDRLLTLFPIWQNETSTHSLDAIRRPVNINYFAFEPINR